MFYKICNDTTGGYIQVGPDQDGIDLVSIKSVDKEVVNEVIMNREEAVLVYQALQAYLKENSCPIVI
jgi:hypothetical protein